LAEAYITIERANAIPYRIGFAPFEFPSGGRASVDVLVEIGLQAKK
jgi:hypothetical protein